MTLKLHDLTNWIRDWLFLSFNLNSTVDVHENATAFINTENNLKFIVNRIGDDDQVIVNQLHNDKIVATSQLKVGSIIKDVSDPSVEDQKSFKKYLHDAFGEKVIAAQNEKAASGKQSTDKTLLQEAINAAEEHNLHSQSVSKDLTDNRTKLNLGGGKSFRPPNPNDPPGFEDEYQLLPQRNNVSIGRTSATTVGERDLYPPGVGRDPTLKPYLDPLAEGIPSGGGGMHPTASDPLFHPEQRNSASLQHPPGARWDNPVFGSDDPEDIERMGQGLPGTGHFGAQFPNSNGKSNSFGGFGGSSTGDHFGGSFGGGFGGGFGF